MKRTNLIAFILITIGSFIAGYLIGNKKPSETITEQKIHIIKDTVEANMLHEMYLNERKKTDSLLKLPVKIKWKYDTIYTTIPDMHTEQLDSIIRANL